MQKTALPYHPVQGKTYTLFGHFETTDVYYNTVRSLTDAILEKEPDIRIVLNVIQKYSERKKMLRKVLAQSMDNSLISYCLHLIQPHLAQFTEKADEHLSHLPVNKRWDRRLKTTREQYHLYMIEIELTNRLNRESFISAGRKIALTPHCLKDFTVNCKARKTGDDMQCRHCSLHCFQNHGSTLMGKNAIEPYIWMEANIKKLARKTLDSNRKLGILGIACIPELVNGMRRCRKYKIPAIGLPLNANRCARWFGEFYPNSIDLRELEILIKA